MIKKGGNYLVDDYLIERNVSLDNVKAKDIPKIVLMVMQFTEDYLDLQTGAEKKKYVINTIESIIKRSKLDINHMEIIDTTIDTYVALDKSVEVINKISKQCCTVS